MWTYVYPFDVSFMGAAILEITWHIICQIKEVGITEIDF